MKSEYNIKGIDKMIKELEEKDLIQLLKIFDCSTSELEENIRDYLKYKNVPSGLEVALYREPDKEVFAIQENQIIDYEKNLKENQERKKRYEEFEDKVIEEGKALELVRLPQVEKMLNCGFYLYIDEPVIYRGDSSRSIGGVSYNCIRCGSKYWEDHKEEIKRLSDSIENIKMQDPAHNRLQTLFKEKEQLQNKIRMMDKEIEEILSSFNTKDEIFFRVKDETKTSEIDKIMQEFVREQKEKDEKQTQEER